MAKSIATQIIEIIKDEWQRIPDALSLYVSDNLGEDIGAAAFRSGGSVRGQRQPRNPKTGRGTLRQVTGDLLRATQPGGRGNISNLSIQSDTVTVEYGIDPDIIPYARIHEFGGTINHPGGTKYYFGPDGDIRFLPNTARRFVGITKPHPIRMPARPYLAPAIEDFQREEIPVIFQRIDKRIRSLF
jgi:phage gpG-like protein